VEGDHYGRNEGLQKQLHEGIRDMTELEAILPHQSGNFLMCENEETGGG